MQLKITIEYNGNFWFDKRPIFRLLPFLVASGRISGQDYRHDKKQLSEVWDKNTDYIQGAVWCLKKEWACKKYLKNI